MAKYRGLVAFSGSIGDLTFSNTVHGKVVKKRSSLDSERFYSDPKFLNSRGALREFLHASSTGKLIRDAFSGSARRAKERSTHYRLNSALVAVIGSDVRSARGARTFAFGNPASLRGFEWNKRYRLFASFSGFQSSTSTDTGKCRIDIAELQPKYGMKIPRGATHFRIHAAAVGIDAIWQSMTDRHAATDFLSVKTEHGAQSFEFDLPHTAGMLMLTGLGLSFYQREGGEMLEMSAGACFAIIDAAVIPTDQTGVRQLMRTAASILQKEVGGKTQKAKEDEAATTPAAAAGRRPVKHLHFLTRPPSPPPG